MSLIYTRFAILFLLLSFLSLPLFAAAPNIEHTQIGGFNVNIYYPPEYDQTDISYPVVYWLHGKGNDESTDLPQMPILDSLIRGGHVTPFIYIMVDEEGEDYFMNTLLPYVDANYRSLGDEARGISGFSMGGMNSNQIAFGNPEKFKVLHTYDGAKADNIPLLEANYQRIKYNEMKIRILNGNKYSEITIPNQQIHELLIHYCIEHEYEELFDIGHVEVVGYAKDPAGGRYVKDTTILAAGFRFISNALVPGSSSIRRRSEYRPVHMSIQQPSGFFIVTDHMISELKIPDYIFNLSGKCISNQYRSISPSKGFYISH